MGSDRKTLELEGKRRITAIHFTSGWPGLGSTLMAGLFGALLSQLSARSEHPILIDDDKRERILHGLFGNYCADCPAVASDTNRGSVQTFCQYCILARSAE